MHRSKRLILFTAFLAVLLPFAALAAQGDLDTSFNSPNGFVLYNGTANGFDFNWATAIQTDGKIVVAGGSNNSTNNDVLVLRYNSNGTLDSSFGTGGVVIYNGAANGDDAVFGVAIQTDGKIVVAGDSENGTNVDALVLRYNSNGTLDSSFGTGGVVIYNGAANGDDWAGAVAIQTDGKIVVTGDSNNATNADALVLRYNSNGTLDSSFGTGGVAIYNGAANGWDSGWGGTAIQTDGKIIVAGSSENGTNQDALVLRYNSNGTLDSGFGTGGVVIYNGAANGNDGVYGGIAIQTDGKIVAVGDSYNGTNEDALILRYNSNGTLDSSFGTGGVVTYSGAANGDDYSYGVAIQTDGKIVVVGESYNGTNLDAFVLRYNSNGTLDSSFGTGGVVIYNGAANGDDAFFGAAIQTDGKIVAVGYASNGLNMDALVFRLIGQPQIAVPTMNEWGMIIFMLLAGFVSVYCLRRKKIAS